MKGKREQTLILTILALAAALVMAAPAWAATPIAVVENNLAISGYDPVSYFDQGEPQKGQEGMEYQWQGATWRFASEKHRKMFMASPEQYAPAYGGYCALSMAQGKAVPADPRVWTIKGKQLYMCGNPGGMKQFTGDAANIDKANANYQKVFTGR